MGEIVNFKEDNGKYKKPKATRKKVKFQGTQTYINKDTGEVLEMSVTEIEERDANFHKIWLGHMLESLDLIGNQKIRVALFIMNNLNRDNEFLMTYDMIEKKAGISRPTIAETMEVLQESDFLQKVKNGHYRINPDVLFKGGKSDRLNILLKYNKSE